MNVFPASCVTHCNKKTCSSKQPRFFVVNLGLSQNNLDYLLLHPLQNDGLISYARCKNKVVDITRYLHKQLKRQLCITVGSRNQPVIRLHLIVSIVVNNMPCIFLCTEVHVIFQKSGTSIWTIYQGREECALLIQDLQINVNVNNPLLLLWIFPRCSVLTP